MFIYCIKNKINGIEYIGSTSNFKGRKKEHLDELTSNKHNNIFLQNDFTKFGIDAFEFFIVAKYECTRERLFKIEQMYLEANSKFLYNQLIGMGYRINRQQKTELKPKHKEIILRRCDIFDIYNIPDKIVSAIYKLGNNRVLACKLYRLTPKMFELIILNGKI